MLQLTRSCALEYAQDRIHINCINPGFAETSLLEPMRGAMGEGFHGMLNQLHPWGRPAVPEDIAKMAVFLAGPGASFITGQPFFVDGKNCPPIQSAKSNDQKVVIRHNKGYLHSILETLSRSTKAAASSTALCIYGGYVDRLERANFVLRCPRVLLLVTGPTTLQWTVGKRGRIHAPSVVLGILST